MSEQLATIAFTAIAVVGAVVTVAVMIHMLCRPRGGRR